MECRPAKSQSDDRRSQRLAERGGADTVQFFLLWGILFINVTAGIGILAQASPMMQDMFSQTPLEAAVIVSLISIFNAGGTISLGLEFRLHRPPEHVHHIFCRSVRRSSC